MIREVAYVFGRSLVALLCFRVAKAKEWGIMGEHEILVMVIMGHATGKAQQWSIACLVDFDFEIFGMHMLHTPPTNRAPVRVWKTHEASALRTGGLALCLMLWARASPPRRIASGALSSTKRRRMSTNRRPPLNEASSGETPFCGCL